MNKFLITISTALLYIGSAPAQDISLTIYNKNIALVREVRDISVEKGISTISFTDVAARIDPTSVHFKSLSQPDKLMILEQNYEYDLVNASKIMQKYIDKDINIVLENGDVFSGRLLSVSRSDIVIRDSSGIKIIKRGGIQHYNFPDLPHGLITRPTLVWMVDNRGSTKQKTEISYLTEAVNWHAEYVGVVDQGESHLDLSGWVSIENNSGATYENARLKLVAGEIHLAKEKKRIRYIAKGEALMAEAPSASQFKEKEFFEYHLYTLNRRTTLKNNQTKQISLFPSSVVKAKKILIYDGYLYGKKVRVYLEFKNSVGEGLGIPLPEGKVRIYKEDVDKALEFIGEDFIDHTPIDEKVRLFMGNAFDVVGERVQKASRKISSKVYQQEYEIDIKNHKKKAVSVLVVEHFWGDWEISKKSHPFVKKDAYTAEFKVDIPARGEVKIEYTVTIRY